MQQLKKNQELIKELMNQRIGVQNDYPVLTDEELKRNRIRKKRKDEVFVLIYISPVSETRYYVSNHARVLSQTPVSHKLNILRQYSDSPNDPKSYLFAKFSNNTKQYMSRLVADAFVMNEYEDGIEDKEAHHINRDRKDNRPQNLVWLSSEDHDMLHKKIDSISMYTDGQCAIEWHRLSAEEMDLEDLILMIEYTEVPLPLFFRQLREQAEHVIEYTGKYSGDRRRMTIKVTGRGLDMPEAISPESGSEKQYKVVVRLKEEFVCQIGHRPLTEKEREDHREDVKSGEFDRRMQQSLKLREQTELFDTV